MIYSISSKTYSCPYEYKHCKYKYRFSGYFLKEDDNAFLACLQKRVINKHITCSFALYSRTQKLHYSKDIRVVVGNIEYFDEFKKKKDDVY